MTFELKFVPQAKKEWKKLPPNIKAQLIKKLEEGLKQPHVPSAKLSGYANVYKIKLKSVGYRLLYEVIDDALVVYVLSIGRRENNEVYTNPSKRYP